MAELNCLTGGDNLGLGCIPIIRAFEKFILVDTFNSLGVANEIDVTGTFNAAYFAALINQTDRTKRWMPTPKVKNVENVRAESLMESFNDGSKEFIEPGIRNIKSLFTGAEASPQFAGKINSHRGSQKSFYGIDKAGNLVGCLGSTSSMLAPIPMEGNTIDAIYQATTDTTIQKIAFNFDVSVTFDDADLRMIAANELSVSIKDLKSLIDVTATYSNKTTTTLSVALKTQGGTLLNPVPVEGLAVTDFVSSSTAATGKMRRTNNTPADVTLTLASESPAGVYNFTFTTQTAGDIEVIKPLKDGFDFTAVVANPVTI